MSFELDEIIPVSKGGDPLDINNVAPAHRICNQRRSNKSLSGTLQKHREDTTTTSRDWLSEGDGLPHSRRW